MKFMKTINIGRNLVQHLIFKFEKNGDRYE
jgi:hypothetical protein